MENIKTVLVLLLNIIFAFLLNFGIIYRLKSYISGKRNNNVTGENMIVYEIMPFLERYHIRERLGMGERHRMPKAPNRYEIKYWSIGLIFSAVYLIVTYYAGFGLVNIGALLFVYVLNSMILNKMYKKSTGVLGVFVNIVLIIASFVPEIIEAVHFKIKGLETVLRYNFIGNGINTNGTAGTEIVKIMSVKWIVLLVIPLIVILVTLFIALIKRRITTVLVSILCCVYITLIYLYIMDVNSFYIFPLTLTAYYYLTMFIFQAIYNKRALKKISVIVK